MKIGEILVNKKKIKINTRILQTDDKRQMYTLFDIIVKECSDITPYFQERDLEKYIAKKEIPRFKEETKIIY